MTDLKPRRGCCEYCVSCIGAENCRQCGAPLRPVPELPEGYREDDEGDLCCGVSILAFAYGNGSFAVGNDELTVLSNSDAQALAIWLQRRAAK